MANKNEKKKIREEKKQAAQRKAKLGGLMVKAVLVIMVPLMAYVFAQGLFSSDPILAPDQIAATDHVRGAEDPALTITVYADFQCPSCLSETEIIATAWPRIDNEVRLVYRYFPLDTHRHAFIAARYAEAASMQESFWPMHDLLFGNQLLWSELPDVTRVFDGYALQLGLDMDQFKLDLESDAVRKKIIADQQGGMRAGVRGTPVMFFNGRRTNNPRSVGEFIEMVNEAVAEA